MSKINQKTRYKEKRDGTPKDQLAFDSINDRYFDNQEFRQSKNFIAQHFMDIGVENTGAKQNYAQIQKKQSLKFEEQKSGDSFIEQKI